jgi:hypothetical protein
LPWSSFGQRDQFGLGLQRGAGVVGLAHPPLGQRAHPLGQPVADVTDFVKP